MQGDGPYSDLAEKLPAVLLDVFRLIDDETLHRLWISRQRWLTKADLVTITGFSQRKIDDLVARRVLPMWRAPGGHEWRITQKEWAACEERLIRDGLLPKNLRARHRGRAPA